ncbi:MAG: hypothetical protein LBQ65_02210 [Tannerellaceae bacterium]|jgi:hypothetical protein|nr:hypothetical protein [Tannerellaceae bacterium]
MDANQLYRLMEDASLLNKDSLPDLKQLVDEYPYFHTARMLYLKNLAMLNDAAFGAELKKTAIYIPDRKMLYALIEEVRLILETRAPKTQQETIDPFALIDQFLDDIPGDMPDPALVLRQSPSIEYLSWSIPGGSEATEEGNNGPQLKHGSLIDAFLEEDELKNQSSRWMDEKDETQYAAPDSIGWLNLQHGDEPKSLDDSYFTETLAKVYIKQKRYGKALEIIRNLSLKYPEKNIYFADQIRFLEKLIINTKKYS